MSFKKQIKGLNENQIKTLIKRSFFDGKSKEITSSKLFKKSRYLKEIYKESKLEYVELFKQLKCNVSPEELWDYMEKDINKHGK